MLWEKWEKCTIFQNGQNYLGGFFENFWKHLDDPLKLPRPSFVYGQFFLYIISMYCIGIYVFCIYCIVYQGTQNDHPPPTEANHKCMDLLFFWSGVTIMVFPFSHFGTGHQQCMAPESANTQGIDVKAAVVKDFNAFLVRPT